MATVEMATDASGNTSTSARGVAKARNWQLTQNKVERYDETVEYLKGLKSLNYLISCKEIAPTTGHEHIHIYCQFNKPIKLSVNKCQGAHIEACKGTPQ